ncbi:MAG: molybdopterin-dependent oxidoreductase [Chloroflexaceae bacterium]|nr:molybdopterin-dependent oxidoreductase [Chloroflexaceae bacterium]
MAGSAGQAATRCVCDGPRPGQQQPRRTCALDALEFVVVQDMFLTETAQLADVVLPAAAVAEYDATYTNTERRVQRARQARPAPGESLPAWAIVQGWRRHSCAAGDNRNHRSGCW